MTDITELAQSLKTAAIDAKELAIIARYSKGRAAAEKFYALANPNNVIALVEALEKAQQRIAELEEAEQKLCAANVTLDARAELAERQRIAELESRTVSVKLLTPEVRNALKAEGLADVLKDAAEYAPLTAGQWETLTKNWYQTFIGLSGSAAGIKVEVE